jgi:hypothetical protein
VVGSGALEGVVALYPNTVHEALLTPAWEELLQRIGDNAMMHLLLRVAVFLPAPNSCWMQVSGTPLRLLLPSGLAKQPAVVVATAPLPGRRANSGTGQLTKVLPKTLYCTKKGARLSVMKRVGKPSKRAARRLLLDIFWHPRNGGHSAAKRAKMYARPRLAQWMGALTGPLRQMIARHRRCNYGAIVRAVCPLAKEMEPSSQSTGESRVATLVRQHTPPSRVTRFLIVAANRVIPRSMWGPRTNRRALEAAVGEFVRLRKKERMTVARAIRGMKVGRVSWLRGVGVGTNPQGTCVKRRLLLGMWVSWTFSAFFAPLIRDFFYCTDTSASQCKIFYYRHELWRKVKAVSMTQLRSGSIFAPISNAEATKVLASRKLGFSFIRILPKTRGVRPILNMSAVRRRPKTAEAFQQSINGALREAFSALTFEKNRDRLGLFGNSIFSLREAYQKFATFIVAWKKLAQKGTDVRCPPPAIYLAKCDVHRSFDTINQQ